MSTTLSTHKSVSAKLASLLRKDALTVFRDRFLLVLLGYGLVIALLMRLFVRFVEIPDLELYLAPATLLVGGILVGTVLGYGLIEEKETRTHLLMQVLPLSPRLRFFYFLLLAACLSLILSLASAAIYGLPVRDRPSFALLAISASLTGPLIALILGVTAANKIEGLAISKIVSGLSTLPALVLIVPYPYQLVLAWNPAYWLYLGLLKAYGSEAGLERLQVHWPPVPETSYWILPFGIALAGSALLESRRRRRVV